MAWTCPPYRFVVFPAAAFLYLVLTPNGRAHWRDKGLWLATLAMCAGLLPLVAFNLSSNFEPLKYQFLRRHPWSFNPAGLKEPLEQALFVTPILYGFLLYTLLRLARAGLRGDDRRGLIGIFGGSFLLLFAALAPWSGRNMYDIHWPIPGYLFLLVYLPGVVREWASAGRVWRRRLAWSGVGMGALGVIAALLFMATALDMERARRYLPTSYTNLPMAGWQELGSRAQGILHRLEARSPELLLVADDYVIGTELEFELGRHQDFFLIDHPRAHKHGTAYQIALWGLDEAALSRQTGRDALIAVDYGQKRVDRRLKRLCTLFERLEPIDTVDLYDRELRVGFFLGHNLAAGDHATRPPCPLPSIVYLNPQARDRKPADTVALRGYAFNDGSGVERVEVYVDDVYLGRAEYGLAAPSVKSRYFPESTDPQHPGVGFLFDWDIRNAPQGRHRAAVKAVAKDGQQDWSKARTITVRHP